MRDDRIGGDDRTNSHFASLKDNATMWQETYAMRTQALEAWEQIQGLYTANIQPKVWSFNHVLVVALVSVAMLSTACLDHFHRPDCLQVTDFVANDWMRVSIEYGQRLHSVVEAGWRVMGQGYRKSHQMSYDEAQLQQAISDYDSRYQVGQFALMFDATLVEVVQLCLSTEACSRVESLMVLLGLPRIWPGQRPSGLSIPRLLPLPGQRLQWGVRRAQQSQPW